MGHHPGRSCPRVWTWALPSLLLCTPAQQLIWLIININNDHLLQNCLLDGQQVSQNQGCEPHPILPWLGMTLLLCRCSLLAPPSRLHLCSLPASLAPGSTCTPLTPLGAVLSTQELLQGQRGLFTAGSHFPASLWAAGAEGRLGRSA